MLFKNRLEAGVKLANQFAYHNNIDFKEAIILALPRGGVPLAVEISKSLEIPFDILLVRKLGAPSHEELAIGAITSDSNIFLNNQLIKELDITQSYIDKIIAKEHAEIIRRDKLYRNNRPFPEIGNKTVIIVDDGIATGATVIAAINAVRKHKPKDIVVATPVISTTTYQLLLLEVKHIIYLIKPEEFYGVGQFYQDFAQVTDSEVIDLLN